MQTRHKVLILLLLFLAAWTPRLLSLDSFVSADERRWVTRSANFYAALHDHAWSDTFQREHPGVTVMWAGTLGFLVRYPAYPDEAQQQFGWSREELEQWLRTSSSRTPLEMLAAGRWWVALLASLLLAVAYLPLARLIDFRLAGVGILFVALDPFLVAHSRLLHPDGLLATLIFLSLLSLLAWLYTGYHRGYLFLAGVTMGLAWLTKVPAAFLTVSGAILIALAVVRRQPERRRLLIGGLLWLLLAAGTAVLLWPALWVAPLQVLHQMRTEMAVYVGGHINTNFFLGRITDYPGPLYYPVAVALRLTPLAMIGLLAALWAIVRQRWPFSVHGVRQLAFGLIVFIAAFTVGMSLVAKRFDRYILPIFPALDLLAVLGMAGLLQWAAQRLGIRGGARGFPQVRPSLILLLLCLVLVGQGLILSLHAPYYLTYFNPLLGGASTAQRALIIGWGEGLDDAAQWVNEQPDGDDARVVAWYGDGPVSYFLQTDHPVLEFWRTDFWVAADYAIVYVNQKQRQYPDSQTLAFFDALAPAYTVERAGVTLAQVYDLRDTAPPAFTGYTRRAALFGDTIELQAFKLPQQTYLPGSMFQPELALESIANVEGEYYTSMTLVDASGKLIWQSDKLPGDRSTDGWARFEARPDVHHLEIPEQAAPGRYRLLLSFHRLEDPAVTLPITVGGHVYPATAYKLAEIQVPALIPAAARVDWGNVELVYVRQLAAAQPGDTVLVQMELEGDLVPGLKMSTRLVSPNGQVVAQVDKPLTEFLDVALRLPDDAPVGTYHVDAVLYDGEDLKALPDSNGTEVVSVSTLEVVN